MPCIKCNNGKWKYGEHGNCQFESLKACRAAEAAIHARENPKKQKHTDCGCEDCKKQCTQKE